MLHDAQGVRAHVELGDLANIAQAKHVVVEEQRLAVEIAQMRHEKAAVGEFGRGQRIVLPLQAQFVELQVADFQRDRGMLDQAVAEHVGRLRKARIPTDENPQHGTSPLEEFPDGSRRAGASIVEGDDGIASMAVRRSNPWVRHSYFRSRWDARLRKKTRSRRLRKICG